MNTHKNESFSCNNQINAIIYEVEVLNAGKNKLFQD